MTIVPKIVHKSGISANTVMPIKVEKTILIYSKGAIKEADVSFRAINIMLWEETPKKPIINNFIKSFEVSIFKSPSRIKADIRTISIFVYNIMVIFESVLDNIFAVIIDNAINKLAKSDVITANSREKELGLITMTTPK